MNLLMTIVPYRQPQSQTWAFARLAEKPFVEGAPEMIDVLTQGIPNAKECFRLLFARREFRYKTRIQV